MKPQPLTRFQAQSLEHAAYELLQWDVIDRSQYEDIYRQVSDRMIG